jgi:hypothetical protein
MTSRIETLLSHAITVKTLAEYAGAVEDVRAKWSKKHDGLRRAWFRGHSKKTWELRPRSHRPPFNQLELRHASHHFGEFKRRSVGLINPPPRTNWGWVYLAQHHGLPTRFLDWSEGSLIGLFFAMQREAGSVHTPRVDPCVWMLNPWALNEDRWGFKEVVSMTEDGIEKEAGATELLSPYLHGDRAETTDGKQVNMLAVIPEYVSPRLTAQRAAFVAFGDYPDELEDFGVREAEKNPSAPALQALVIPKHLAMNVRYELDAAGVAESTLFPDIDGLAKEIARRWDNPRM